MNIVQREIGIVVVDNRIKRNPRLDQFKHILHLDARSRYTRLPKMSGWVNSNIRHIKKYRRSLSRNQSGGV